MTSNSDSMGTAPRRAVAVSGERDGDAPRVTATGEGALAEQILDLAFEHGVRVRQDPALADILATLEVDSPIPMEALTTVSMVLEQVYRADRQAAGATPDAHLDVTGGATEPVEGIYRRTPVPPATQGNSDG